jgi:hypothetical protein
MSAKAAASAVGSRSLAKNAARAKTPARRSAFAALSGISSPTVLSPDFTAVGPAKAEIVSPEIF